VSTASAPKRRKRGGRPPKITEEVVAIVARELRRSAFFSTACEIAGITPQTGYTYVKQGKRAKRGSLLRQFFDVCRKAKADGEMKLVDVIYNDATSNKSPKSAAWLLSRRHRTKYADRIEVKGALKGKVDHRHLHAVIIHGGETGIEAPPAATPALTSEVRIIGEVEAGAADSAAKSPATREWNPVQKAVRTKRLEQLRERARKRLQEEDQ
jgi:hypothetical protein